METINGTDIPGEDVHVPNALLVVGTVLAGCLGLTLNSVALYGLPHCKLCHSAKLLMIAMCIGNMCALLPITFTAPFVRIVGTDRMFRQNDILGRLPGAMLILGMYMNQGNQLALAFNRLITIVLPHYSRQLLGGRKAYLWATTVFLYGLTFATVGLNECCRCTYYEVEHGIFVWLYTGTRAAVHAKAVFIFTIPVVLTFLTVYPLITWRIRLLRKDIVAPTIRNRALRREITLTSQFCITCGLYTVWMGTAFITMNFPQMHWFLAVTELARYVNMTIDPSLYLLRLEQLREAIRYKLTNPCNPMPEERSGNSRTVSGDDSRRKFLEVYLSDFTA